MNPYESPTETNPIGDRSSQVTWIKDRLALVATALIVIAINLGGFILGFAPYVSIIAMVPFFVIPWLWKELCRLWANPSN